MIIKHQIDQDYSHFPRIDTHLKLIFVEILLQFVHDKTATLMRNKREKPPGWQRSPEEQRDDGHQGGAGQDHLDPLVLVHLRPPDARLPAGGHLAPPLVVGGEAVEDGALGVTDTSYAHT